MTRRTQLNRLRAHLQAGRSITPLNALEKLGSLRLSARVYDLRREGLDVKTTLVQCGRARYARYSLERP